MATNKPFDLPPIHDPPTPRPPEPHPDGWTRRLTLLVGECIRQQRLGMDVLASAAWDEFLRGSSTDICK